MARRKRRATPRHRSSPELPEDAHRVIEDRLQSVIDLSSEYYWETGPDHRFTQLLGRNDEADLRRAFLGQTRWEIGGKPVADEGRWDAHRQMLEGRHPFRDYVYTFEHPEEGRRYLSISGKPMFDRLGVFQGYRGITRDVTEDMRTDSVMRLETIIQRLLTGSEDIGHAVTSAIRAICESQDWEAGSFWKFEETSGLIGYAGGWCTDGKPVLAQISERAQTFSFRAGEGLPGHVFQTGEPLWVPDIRRDSRVTDHRVTELTGWNSAFLFPIRSGEATLGVLDFYAPRIRRPDDRLLRVIGILGQEIGHFYQRALALERLRDSEQLYAATFDLAEIGIAHVGIDGRFLHANRCLCRMLGYSRAELLSRTVRDISHPEDVDVTRADRERLRAGEIESFRCEKRYVRKDGSVMWASLTVASKRDSSGECAYDISIIQDISAGKETEERIRHLATHDVLTGLPNRVLFGQLLTHAIEAARRHERKFAVLFVDLDGFKVVNDTLGHDAGDVLLKEISRRLQTSLRASDVVARLGGDEFIVLAEEVADPSHAAGIARKVLDTAQKPVSILGCDCRVTASVGVCMFPADAGDEQTLMKRADTAMYAAKSAGKNSFRFFSSGDAGPSV